MRVQCTGDKSLASNTSAQRNNATVADSKRCCVEDKSKERRKEVGT
jgi:hypothetical protein